MNIILIDDEAPVRANLKALLTRYIPEGEVIGEADGVQSGLKLLEEKTPDLLFLDVEMKDGTGFDLLSQYGPPEFNVIFATGHDRYAVKAFKYSAIDYLIKPVEPNELRQAVDRATAQPKSERTQKVDNLIENQKRPSADQKILLKDLETVYLVAVKDIIRCESVNNYTIFWLHDGRKITITITLKEYERLLSDQGFFRSHQSHLINLEHFDRFDKKEGGIIYMKDGSKVLIANRKKDLLIERLKQLN